MSKKDDSGKKPHYTGHRQRLRERFMATGEDRFPDYELLELLLFHSIARIDVKPLAKSLIEKFGSFAAVISAEPDRLRETDKINEKTVVHLKAVRAAALRLAREDVMDKPVMSSWQSLIDYCRASMGHETTERFRILYLNRKNALIADEVQQKGTVDHTPVYPREVIKRALELSATAIIMVHNHPSGDPAPSRSDIEMTQKVKEAGEKLGITIHDHVIVAKGGHTSFKTMGLL